MATQSRGQLTRRIEIASKKLLGGVIDQTELRLMPYIIDVMMNSQKIDPSKLNHEERRILQTWRIAGHIQGGASGMQITTEFWNILCEIVRLGYVELTD